MKKKNVIMLLRILFCAITAYFWYDALRLTYYPPVDFYSAPFWELYKVGVAGTYVIAMGFTAMVTIGWKWMTKDF